MFVQSGRLGLLISEQYVWLAAIKSVCANITIGGTLQKGGTSSIWQNQQLAERKKQSVENKYPAINYSRTFPLLGLSTSSVTRLGSF